MEKSIKDNHPIAWSPFTILGAGSWGTALGLHLSRLGQTVNLWTFEKEHAEMMQREGVNQRYLPQQAFPSTLKPTADLKWALDNAEDILIAVPSLGFQNIILQLKKMLTSPKRLVVATKGLDHTHGHLLHEVVTEILDNQVSLAVLSGPSFAREVAIGLPTAVVIASEEQTFAESLLNRFTSDRFRVYLSTDICGVEIGGVVKNVLAIATGISDGMGFGANARCALITRGLAEMMRLGISLGAKIETLNGLAGLGDLILTCTDNQSRNRRFGLSLGQGHSVGDAEKSIGQVIEGKQNTIFLRQLAKKHQVEMPIVEIVSQIVEEKITPFDAMQNLLSRTPKRE